MCDEHFLASHLYAFEWSDGFLAGKIGPSSRDNARCESNRVRDFGLRRFLSGDRGQLSQNLLECQILFSEDVALADPSVFGGKQVAFRRITRIHKIQSGVYEGGKAIEQEI